MAAGSPFSFRVLGTFEVLEDGRPLDLGGRKPAGLLALLVLHANEALPTDRLVDELWDGHPPRTARKSLQVHVSRLRRALGEGVLETRPHGYLLRAAPDRVDATVFERLVDEGRAALRADDPDTAARALHEALSLWRGPALAGLDEPFARTYGARLEEERLAAVELRIEADLALGRHAELVVELEALVAQNPYREGLRRQLMLALYRSGRQADALAAYRAARATLTGELGIEPGPELRELEAAVLRHDSSLEAPRRPLVRARRSRPLLVAAGIAAAALVSAALAFGAASRGSSEPPPQVVPDSLLEIDAATNEVVKVTKMGRDPAEVAFGAGTVWVVNQKDRTVSRVRHGEVDTIGGAPYLDHVVVDGEDVWVSSFDRASIVRIDASSAEIAETVGIPSRHAEGLAVGGGYLWITNPSTVRAQGTETVSRYDLRSREVVSTIAVGKTPIFTTFGLGSVWVSNYDGDTVSVIGPGSASAETVDLEGCDGPLGIATGHGAVWVVCYWTQELLRIDPDSRQVADRVPVGQGPLEVAVGEGSVWVTNRDSRSVSRIDPSSNEVVAEISVPAPATPWGVGTGGGAVWVTTRRCPQQPCF